MGDLAGSVYQTDQSPDAPGCAEDGGWSSAALAHLDPVPCRTSAALALVCTFEAEDFFFIGKRNFQQAVDELHSDANCCWFRSLHRS